MLKLILIPTCKYYLLKLNVSNYNEILDEQTITKINCQENILFFFKYFYKKSRKKKNYLFILYIVKIQLICAEAI